MKKAPAWGLFCFSSKIVPSVAIVTTRRGRNLPLADFLAVDRSAMSNELSKMQRDGLLTFRKNHFELL